MGEASAATGRVIAEADRGAGPQEQHVTELRQGQQDRVVLLGRQQLQL